MYFFNQLIFVASCRYEPGLRIKLRTSLPRTKHDTHSGVSVGGTQCSVPIAVARTFVTLHTSRATC